MTTSDEREALEEFSERYAGAPTDAERAVEAAVIGGDWGANGYTTMAQADRIGQLLELAPGRTLLDAGAGRGWPGLYLAVTTGCEVVLSDLPPEGLRLARIRAGREHVAERVSVVVAAAGRPPFPPASFDAVTHTDVLC